MNLVKIEYLIAGAVVATFYGLDVDSASVAAQHHLAAYPAVENAIIHHVGDFYGKMMPLERHVARATEWQKRNG